jgi:predicted alpha-1,2-mannosidase
LEFASGHFALGLVADALGKTGDAGALMANAGHWRNVIDPATRFARPHNADGSWGGTTLPDGTFVPEDSSGFKEGTAWQWTWLVPQDVNGLAAYVDAGAGTPADTTVARLDQFFATPASATVPLAPGQAQSMASVFGIAYYGNQYTPSNEDDLQAPFLYDWLGQPWKTQALARQYQQVYHPTPEGMPGNDDLGTMSAWLVWNDLGFYPATPGAPLVEVGSPLFTSATIRVPGGSFTVDAPGASHAAKYVQSASVNNAPLSKTYFATRSIAAGGSVRFEMGAAPNLSWGATLDDAPPSMSTDPPATFGCTI